MGTGDCGWGSDKMQKEDEEPGKPGCQIYRLNAGECACLELVAKGKSSKQIARELDAKPYTVDDRIRSACRKLNANNRTHAAQIYMAAISGLKTKTSVDLSKLRHEYSGIPDDRSLREKGSSAGESDGSDEYDRERIHRLVSLGDSGGRKARPKTSHPFAKFFWGTNRLSARRRALIILALSLGFVVAVGTVVNVMDVLSRLLDAPIEPPPVGAAEGV
jgi:DNA-binding CsgD family transcriptional regulator